MKITDVGAAYSPQFVKVGTPMLEMNPEKREWVGLTEDEITKLHHEIKAQLMGTYKTEDIYRAIEAKLKDKNT
jgi:hypothetical protein